MQKFGDAKIFHFTVLCGPRGEKTCLQGISQSEFETCVKFTYDTS